MESTGALLVVLRAADQSRGSCGRPPSDRRPPGRPEDQLAVALAGGETAALVELLELDLRGLLDRREEPADGPAGAADVVHLLGHRRAAVGERAVAVRVDRAEGLVHLDELTAAAAAG